MDTMLETATHSVDTSEVRRHVDVNVTLVNPCHGFRALLCYTGGSGPGQADVQWNQGVERVLASRVRQRLSPCKLVCNGKEHLEQHRWRLGGYPYRLQGASQAQRRRW